MNADPRTRTIGSSPYATGGGGVTFERRVATRYLASLLTVAGHPETKDCPVVRVDFQTGPRHYVDDLLVHCADARFSYSLAIACRAKPNFVQSDDDTVKLFLTVVREVVVHGGPGFGVGIASAGRSSQSREMAELTTLARSHSSASSFATALRTTGRHRQELLRRFEHLVGMIPDSDFEIAGDIIDTSSAIEKEDLVWRALSPLWILQLEVQPPDEEGWSRIATQLAGRFESWADGPSLRTHLESRAASFAAQGASVDRAMLLLQVGSERYEPVDSSSTDDIARSRQVVGRRTLDSASTLDDVVQSLGALISDSSMPDAKRITTSLLGWRHARLRLAASDRERLLTRVRFAMAVSHVLRDGLPPILRENYSQQRGYTSSSAFSVSSSALAVVCAGGDVLNDFADDIVDRVILAVHDRTIGALLLGTLVGEDNFSAVFESEAREPARTVSAQLSMNWASVRAAEPQASREFIVIASQPENFTFRVTVPDSTIGLVDYVPEAARSALSAAVGNSPLASELKDWDAWWLIAVPFAFQSAANFAPKDTADLVPFAARVFSWLEAPDTFHVGIP